MFRTFFGISSIHGGQTYSQRAEEVLTHTTAGQAFESNEVMVAITQSNTHQARWYQRKR